MKKEDLKTGMIVETITAFLLVLKDTYFSPTDDPIFINSVGMRCETYGDIVRVWKPKKLFPTIKTFLVAGFNEEEYELIWDSYHHTIIINSVEVEIRSETYNNLIKEYINKQS